MSGLSEYETPLTRGAKWSFLNKLQSPRLVIGASTYGMLSIQELPVENRPKLRHEVAGDRYQYLV